MNENERAYFLSLSFARQLAYLETAWGVKVSVAVDMVYDQRRKAVLVASAGVLDALHASELHFPPPVVLTTRLKPSTSLDRFLGELLICWVRTIKDHMSTESD